MHIWLHAMQNRYVISKNNNTIPTFVKKDL